MLMTGQKFKHVFRTHQIGSYYGYLNLWTMHYELCNFFSAYFKNMQNKNVITNTEKRSTCSVF